MSVSRCFKASQQRLACSRGLLGERGGRLRHRAVEREQGDVVEVAAAVPAVAGLRKYGDHTRGRSERRVEDVRRSDAHRDIRWSRDSEEVPVIALHVHAVSGRHHDRR